VNNECSVFCVALPHRLLTLRVLPPIVGCLQRDSATERSGR
jgi:hypothetical protein